MDILLWKMNSDNKDEPSKNVICYVILLYIWWGILMKFDFFRLTRGI